jgi:hypothetical protein
LRNCRPCGKRLSQRWRISSDELLSAQLQPFTLSPAFPSSRDLGFYTSKYYSPIMLSVRIVVVAVSKWNKELLTDDFHSLALMDLRAGSEAGENQANRLYPYFAENADIEGHSDGFVGVYRLESRPPS